MTTLTADALAETHPMLKPGFRRSMVEIRSRGGPWHCPNCGGPSYQCYRCSACGKDLARTESTTGRLGVNR